MRVVYTAIFHNFFLKLIALFLAVVTWAYVANELYRQVPEAQRGQQPVVALEDKEVVIKKVPVHINIVGMPDKRYKILFDRIRIYPSDCVISGPLASVEPVSFLITEPVSVEGSTRTIRQDVKLKEIPGCVIDKEQAFQVVIPVTKKTFR